MSSHPALGKSAILIRGSGRSYVVQGSAVHPCSAVAAVTSPGMDAQKI